MHDNYYYSNFVCVRITMIRIRIKDNTPGKPTDTCIFFLKFSFACILNQRSSFTDIT